MPKQNDIPQQVAEQMGDATEALMSFIRAELIKHDFFLLDSESTDHYINDLRPHLEAACAAEPDDDDRTIRVMHVVTGFGAAPTGGLGENDLVFAIMAVVLNNEITSMNFVACGPYGGWCDGMAAKIASRVRDYMDAGAELAQRAMLDDYLKNEDAIH